ncbi:MAG: hypothetical protein B7Z41_09770 [Rhizobiales bacterium 12-66-7]|nr:MAG: hypothetical protein B7Z41_09770 [Rhizobiales bacterium 12-66-7]
MSDTSQIDRTEAPPPPKTDVVEKKDLPTLATGGSLGAIIPENIDQVWRLATILCQAEMVPKSLNTPAKATVAIMHGMEVGLMPLQAMQSIAVINNMPSIYGDAMLALVISKPVYGDHKESIEFDDQGVPWSATCSARRKGSNEWRTQTITRAQAQKAGWWSKAGPWSATPQRMLQMRARGWCLRDTFPDVLRGLVMAEEAADIVDITEQGSATTSRPPEPKRTDFTKDGPHRTAAKPAANISDAEPAHDAETSEIQKPTAATWFPDVVGQDAITTAIIALITDKATSLADLDAIHAANAERVAKFTQANRAKITNAMDDRREDLGGK